MDNKMILIIIFLVVAIIIAKLVGKLFKVFLAVTAAVIAATAITACSIDVEVGKGDTIREEAVYAHKNIHNNYSINHLSDRL